MIDITKLSTNYHVYRLDDSDVDRIFELCMRNPQYYRYTEAEPTREEILKDLHITPPGIAASNKYYVGFYQDKELIAVMDLVDGYPKADIAYIGFFMMNLKYQGNQIGTAIISEVIDYLKSIGKTSVRLAIDKGNPQSSHFWKKNSFEVISETNVNGWNKLVAERKLP